MNFHSLKVRFLALAVTFMVVAVGFRLVVALPFAQELLRELVSNQQLSIAGYIARDVDHNIVARRDFIKELAVHVPPALLDKHDALSAWLGQHQQLMPLFEEGFVLIRADGNGVLADFPVVAARSKLTHANTDWFQQVLATKQVVISRPHLGRLAKRPLLIMAAPVMDANGKVLAVLAGAAPLSGPGFLDRMQEQRLGNSGSFLLISPQDKVFVAASDPSMVLQPTPPPGMVPLHDRGMGGFRGTDVTINAKGVEEFAALVSVPSTGWYVVARMPTAEAFKPVNALRDFQVGSTSVLFLVMVTLLMLILPRILRPLTDTARAMRDMADGRRELAALPVTRKDEVGDLVLGFNYLVARLREKEAALRASEAHMAFIAHHDSLTGLFNRTMLEDRLQQALARAERDERHFALLFCDLDFFKPINDDFGHEVGDAVLVEVAARLTNGRRRVDTVARHGGDEFVVLLTDLDDAHADAEAVARQYLHALAQPFLVDSRSFTLSASIGIALFQGERISVSQLMSRADVAMYQAKRAGKNTLCFFGDNMPPAPVASPAPIVS